MIKIVEIVEKVTKDGQIKMLTCLVSFIFLPRYPG